MFLDADRVTSLEQLFENRADIAFAFLFGSALTGRLTDESDADIGVYFLPNVNPEGRVPLEIEEETCYPAEYEIALAAERIVERNVDLVVLNRATADVALAAVEEGMILCDRRPDLRTRFRLAASDVAASFDEFFEDYCAIRERSRSLSAAERRRLVRILEFLSEELDSADRYSQATRETYLSDPHFRRAIERWAENLVNASIDIAKIVTAAEHLPAGHSYREAVASLSAVAPFQELAERLARNVRVRNVLAHEYLDIRWNDVKRVAEEGPGLYRELVEKTRSWIA